MKLINPELLFISEPPFLTPVNSDNYYDKTEIGMENYLQILPSVGLYGIQYKIFIDESNKVLDGNFRVYAALELGIMVPVTIQKTMHYYNIWVLRAIRRCRLLFKRNWLFFKKIRVRKTASKSSLIIHFQKNILNESS